MRHAEHLAVVEHRCSALGPGRDVVGFHLLQRVDACRVVVGAGGTQRAVRLVRGLGGDITLTSRLGEGTTFRVTLPIDLRAAIRSNDE